MADFRGEQLDRMLNKMEGSFQVASARRMSFVQQRRAELEIMHPFTEARELMIASLTDPEDRDRSRLAALMVGDETPRIARARSASDQVERSELKLPPDVLRAFVAACDSCERVLADSTHGEQLRRVEWIDTMKRAAEAYLARMKAKQEDQDELEEAAMRKALGLESSETQEDTSSTTSTEEQDELEEAAIRKALELELPEDVSSNASTEEPFSDAACAEELLPHAEEEEEERALLPLAEELSHVEECEALQLLEDFLGERGPNFRDLFAKPSGSRTKKKSRARRERPSLLCLGARPGKNKK